MILTNSFKSSSHHDRKAWWKNSYSFDLGASSELCRSEAEMAGSRLLLLDGAQPSDEVTPTVRGFFFLQLVLSGGTSQTHASLRLLLTQSAIMPPHVHSLFEEAFPHTAGLLASGHIQTNIFITVLSINIPLSGELVSKLVNFGASVVFQVLVKGIDNTTAIPMWYYKYFLHLCLNQFQWFFFVCF